MTNSPHQTATGTIITTPSADQRPWVAAQTAGGAYVGGGKVTNVNKFGGKNGKILTLAIIYIYSIILPSIQNRHLHYTFFRSSQH